MTPQQQAMVAEILAVDDYEAQVFTGNGDDHNGPRPNDDVLLLVDSGTRVICVSAAGNTSCAWLVRRDPQDDDNAGWSSEKLP